MYELLGLPCTVGIISKNIRTEVWDQVFSFKNQYYRFKFDTNINSKPYSILSILSRPELIPFVGGSLENPFTYKDKALICLRDENNNKTFLQELSTSLSRFDIIDDEPIPTNEALKFKGINNHCFNSVTPQGIYKNINNFLLNSFSDKETPLCNEVYVSSMGTVNITSLVFVIKEFIMANSNLNSPVIIPDTVIKPLLNALNKLPNTHKMWYEISIKNAKLYTELKSNDSDNAVNMHDMGFSD